MNRHTWKRLGFAVALAVLPASAGGSAIADEPGEPDAAAFEAAQELSTQDTPAGDVVSGRGIDGMEE